MKKRYIVSIIILSMILVSVLIFDHIASNSSQSNHNDILTLDKIRSNYKPEGLKSITQFSDHYALVNILDEYCRDLFEVYNLETGDRDILPTLPNKVTLDKIIDENTIIFLANGENYESSNITFPFKIDCRRTIENTKSNLDYYPSYEDLFLQSDETVTFGKNTNSIISDLKLTLNGLEILFEPISKDDINFFSDQANVPRTSTHFFKDKNQLAINFANTTFNKELLKNELLMSYSNLYFKSLEIVQDNINTTLLFDLKESGTMYNIKVNHLKNNLPFAVITFK